MGATYTRQSSSGIVDGGVIEATDINNEFDQLLAAFAVSSGHTHDGTAAEGGPITKLLGTAITIGDGTSGTDIAVTFDGESADGVLTWMEDEDYFKFSDEVLMNSTEKLLFGDTGTYIHQSADGVLDLVSDTEIEINATTIDVNGTTNFSGAITPAASDGAALGTTSLEWSDLYLADGAVVGVGDDQDVTLTHVADTGLLLNSTMAIQFNDASQYINAPSNAILDINATDEIELNATLIDINGNLDVSGTVTLADGSLAIADLDIDGGTDIGEAIVDADLFIVDNGAGGTNRKTTASRLKTYIGSISQANQAALEAQTNEDTYAPPDLMHHHPGMVKAWCKWDIAATVNASHNVSSVTDSATGLWTINWNTDFSSVNYAVACSWRDDNDKVEFQCSGGSSAAGTYEFKLVNGGGSLVDAAAADDMHVIAVGDH